MTGGELQTNGGTSTTSGYAFQWNRTSLTTNASANSAVISGRINLRNDAGYSSWNVNVADGAADARGPLFAAARRADAPAVLAAFKDWLWHFATLKTLSIGKAAAYAIANWDRLTCFVDNPRVPLDNNATERAIRGPVVGRKNHYGSRSARGGPCKPRPPVLPWLSGGLCETS